MIAAIVVAALGQGLGLAYLAMAATPGGATRLAGVKAFPYGFVGWREASALVLPARRDGTVLVADNFALAAELSFALDDRQSVYSLDSPLNVKHGRAPQLARWQLDGTALRREHAGQPMLLAVEETTLSERERLDWLGAICRRIDAPQPIGRLELYHWRKRVALYLGRVPLQAPGDGPVTPEEPATCPIWRAAHAADAKRYGTG
jgi:hypothetical protein